MCAFGIVRLTTISIAGSASSASTGTARVPNSAARASAAAGFRSATARTSSTGKRRAAFRYAPLIVPQPMKPMPTLSDTPRAGG
jgi:hypothetical protein